MSVLPPEGEEEGLRGLQERVLLVRYVFLLSFPMIRSRRFVLFLEKEKTKERARARPFEPTRSLTLLPLSPSPKGPTCPRSHIPLQLCTLYASGFCPFGPSCTSGHPKDDLPPLSAYRPPTPPLSEAPGPPPPGYGRYSEFDPKTIGTHTFQRKWEDRGGGGGRGGFGGGGGRGGGGGGGGGGERDNSSVLCFKCNQKGHYA